MAGSANDKKNIVLEPSERRTEIDQLMVHSIIWNVFRPLLVILISVAVVLFGCYNAYKYVVAHYVSPVDPNDKTPITVEIKYGAYLKNISQMLEDNKLVRSAAVFKYYTDFSNRSSRLKSGTFELNKSMTMDEIIRELSHGSESRQEISVVLVEGITIDEMALRLKEKGVIKDADEFRNACKWDEKYANYSMLVSNFAGDKKNKERRYMLEGYLFPDTYKFFLDSSVESVIQRLLDQYDSVIKPDWEQKAEEMGITMDEAIILASLIEKEGYEKDFAKISAVFHNRLNEGMRLDSDATINYAVHSKNLLLTEEQLKTDSPYNTRKYKGFPIGPICNPGQAAIIAALYPNEEYINEGYLYFTLVDPKTGEIAYNKTQKEHDKASQEAADALAEHDKQNAR